MIWEKSKFYVDFYSCLDMGSYEEGEVVGLDPSDSFCKRGKLSSTFNTIGGVVPEQTEISDMDMQNYILREQYIWLNNDPEYPLLKEDVGRENSSIIYWKDGKTLTKSNITGLFLVEKANRPIDIGSDGRLGCWVGSV